jgi:hypothetical protein
MIKGHPLVNLDVFNTRLGLPGLLDLLGSFPVFVIITDALLAFLDRFARVRILILIVSTLPGWLGVGRNIKLCTMLNRAKLSNWDA